MDHSQPGDPDVTAELPLLDLKASPTSPPGAWDKFMREYRQTNEAYQRASVCHRLAQNETNKVARDQWNAWLWYLINQRFSG